ncbi:MAG: hypothetical protein ABIO69_06620 [Sphingomicrobium sp.]
MLPRRGGFAGAQAHHHVAHPDRLPRLERQVAHDPVALVEQAEHGDPLCHRSHSGLADRSRGDLGRSRAIGHNLLRLVATIAATGGERQRHQTCRESAHAQSGVHG